MQSKTPSRQQKPTPLYPSGKEILPLLPLTCLFSMNSSSSLKAQHLGDLWYTNATESFPLPTIGTCPWYAPAFIITFLLLIGTYKLTSQ